MVAILKRKNKHSKLGENSKEKERNEDNQCKKKMKKVYLYAFQFFFLKKYFCLDKQKLKILVFKNFNDGIIFYYFLNLM